MKTKLASLVVMALVGIFTVAMGGERRAPTPVPSKKAESGKKEKGPKHPPPDIVVAPPETPVSVERDFHQRSYAPQPFLVDPDQANEIIEQFKKAYDKLGSPIVAMYVNRALIDQESGVRMTHHSVKTKTIRGEVHSDFEPADTQGAGGDQTTSIHAGGDVTLHGAGRLEALAGKGTIQGEVERKRETTRYEVGPAKPPSLADRQTTREVERLFGRPLRAAGVRLADQRLAAELMEGRKIADLKQAALAGEGDQARKDREALAKHADVVLEVLISSRQVTAPTLTGDQIFEIPDIQATAIRLSDAQVIGQAASSDVLGQDQSARTLARRFDVRDITEATALALMEDMMLGVPVDSGESTP